MNTADNTSNDREIDVVGPSAIGRDDDLWGDVPCDERLDWLRLASRHWPFYPGAAVGGLTAASLSKGVPVRSTALIGLARNAYEAGFTRDEYEQLRRLVRHEVPESLIVRRDPRPQHAERWFELDAGQWRGWLTRVRAGQAPEIALADFYGELNV